MCTTEQRQELIYFQRHFLRTRTKEHYICEGLFETKCSRKKCTTRTSHGTYVRILVWSDKSSLRWASRAFQGVPQSTKVSSASQPNIYDIRSASDEFYILNPLSDSPLVREPWYWLPFDVFMGWLHSRVFRRNFLSPSPLPSSILQHRLIIGYTNGELSCALNIITLLPSPQLGRVTYGESITNRRNG